jgi:hypothetical protein
VLPLHHLTGALLNDACRPHVSTHVQAMKRLREPSMAVMHGGHFDGVGRERYRALIGEYVAGERGAG